MIFYIFIILCSLSLVFHILWKRRSGRANNYWISWYHDVETGEFELYFPWWKTGERLDGGVWSVCAAVRASNVVGAEKVILESYGTYPDHLEFRFVENRPRNFSPFCERFPRADWMEWD